MSFESQVKAAICRHEFNPVCIEATARAARKKKTDRAWYDRKMQDPEFRKHRAELQKVYRSTPEGKAKHAEEQRRYREKKGKEWQQKELERLRANYKPKPYQRKTERKPVAEWRGMKILNVKLIKGN